MELAPSGVSLTFEVTYSSSGLPVAMSVYDTTGESPVLVQGPAAMEHVVAGTYIGSFTAQNNKTYLIFKAVYTDDTFETIDTAYGQGSESIVTDDSGANTGVEAGCAIVGYVQPSNTVVGFVEC